MDVKEIAAVVAYLNAAYPNIELPDETLAVWAEHIGHVQPDTALEAARSWVRTQKWFPSISEFLAESAEVAKRKAQRSKLPALEEAPPVPPEVAKENVVKLRQALRSVRRSESAEA